ncbi:MAG: NAD-binding protein, partial [Desulfobacterales bacterium]|nr:NAD-binding protein [Desulfobacterales bacterium]
NTALLIERLIREGEEVSVLQSLQDIFHHAHCQGATVITGDPEDETILKSLGAETAAGLVVILNDPDRDIAVCRLARERFRIPVVVSRADEHSSMEKMVALGVKVVQPSLATAIALEGALRYPATFDMIAEQVDGVELGEATLLNSRFQGIPISEVRLPGNALIIGIRRNGDVIVPHSYTALSLHDVVMLVGNPESIKETIHLLREE